MRNSYVDIRGNAPDTSDLDVGWDFEPDSLELPEEPVFSLLPSHSSIRPSRAARRPKQVNPLSRSPSRAAAPGLDSRARLAFAAALVAAAGVGAGAVVGFQRIRSAPVAHVNSAVDAEGRDLAPATLAVVSARIAAPAPPLLDPPIVPAPLARAEDPAATTSERRPILIQVDPPAASVSVGGQRLGNDLVNVELAPGQHKTATVTLPGYRTRTVELDGNADFIQVTLLPIARAKSRSPRPVNSESPVVGASNTPAPKTNAAPGVFSDMQSAARQTPSAEADVAYPE